MLESEIAASKSAAFAHLKRGEIAQAIEVFTRYCAAVPEDALAMSNLGAILMSCDRVTEAVSWLRKATEADPGLVAAWTNLGITLQSTGEHRAAHAAYKKAIMLAPQAAAPLAGLGSLMRKIGDRERAVKYLRRAVSLDPTAAKARVRLAECLIEQDKPDEARKEAEEIKFLVGSPEFPHLAFGSLLAQLNLRTQAIQHLEIAAHRDPIQGSMAAMLLAAVGSSPMPVQAPKPLMLKIYSRRAMTWDVSHEARNSYCAHVLVNAAFTRIAAHGAGLSILDLGCGTGLVGSLVRARANILHGVDLSPEMLARARTKAIYDALFEEDVTAYLRWQSTEYDYLLSAATLVHIGDLRPIIQAMFSALKPGGRSIFTVFPYREDEWTYGVGPLGGLAEGGIFAHGKMYLMKIAQNAGFQIESMDEGIHEYHEGIARIGLCVSLLRP